MMIVMDIKILVVTHKTYWRPKADIYIPIAVGNNLVKGNCLRDSTGENISQKNKNYCELTAMYWAWKNLKADYIGLCHYRRYFTVNIRTVFTRPISTLYDFLFLKDDLYNKLKKILIMKEKDYKNILYKYDVIVAKKMPLIDGLTVEDDYKHQHKEKDIKIVRDVIADIYPEDEKYFNDILNRKEIHLFNMFVMNNKNFQEYCQWLFSILFEVEKRIDISDYDDYQARVYGFLAERLFNVWLLKKNFNVYEANVNFLDGKFKLGNFIKLLMKKF